MQSLREEDALIPRARGSLPKLCASVLAAVAIATIILVSPGQLVGWSAAAALMVTLGHLLHGVCLLAEEQLYHSHTRHRGQSLLGHMLPACGFGGRTLLVAGLSCLLLHLTRQSQPLKNHSWELVVLVPVVYALFKSLGVLGPSEVEVSDICEERKMNVAHGLAWSYYLGYLQLVLPRLEDAINAFQVSHECKQLWGRGSQKLFILLPLNANISHKIEDGDSRIRFYDNLPNNEIDRAGVRGRVYKHTVYTVQDEQGKAHDCVLEYATPLLTLYHMSQDRTAGFGEPERRQQVLLFYRTLQDVLERSLECRNRYTLILLNDEQGADPHYLSKAILRHLQQQATEEFCLTPPPRRGAERHNAEPMSREPTIMVSLDQPRPLKVPVEDVDTNYRME